MSAAAIPPDVFEAARLGDPRAITSLLETAQPDIRRYARATCRSSADAEDATQEALWILFRHVGTIRSLLALSAWLFSVVRRECLRLARKAGLASGTGEGEVEAFWLSRFSPKHAEGLGRVFKDGWENPIDDLGAIKSELDRSAKAVRDAVAEGIEAGGAPAGGYDHPVIFLQHMVWHEGWHVGLLMLGLRVAGQEPPEEWEEPNVWGQWRVE